MFVFVLLAATLPHLSNTPQPIQRASRYTVGRDPSSNPFPLCVCLFFFFLSIRSIRRSSNERRQHQTRRPLNGNTRAGNIRHSIQHAFGRRIPAAHSSTFLLFIILSKSQFFYFTTFDDFIFPLFDFLLFFNQQNEFLFFIISSPLPFENEIEKGGWGCWRNSRSCDE